jgi:hypothetical protein
LECGRFVKKEEKMPRGVTETLSRSQVGKETLSSSFDGRPEFTAAERVCVCGKKQGVYI